MLNLLNIFNDFLWTYILIAMLLCIGLFFSFKTKFIQVRYLKHMFKLLGEGAIKSKDNEHTHGISSFQAFCISTASRVGTGNLAGVAIAISIGGPGAVFWMWVIALIGGASSFVESTLAQIYKIKDGKEFRGGPAYYIEKGLNNRFMGIVFSILITICFGLAFNSVQSNTITLAFNEAFGLNKVVIGLVLAALTSFIIFGGVKRIAKASEVLVPIMAVLYLLIVLFVLLKNISIIPNTILLIVENAFGFKQTVGGGLGYAVLMGVKRGLFSNEAGMGSAPNAAAAAHVTHPVKQGLIQTLGVFTDTLLICTATALLILSSDIYSTTDLVGIQLTQASLSSQIGSFGNIFIAICILLFAFSSIIGNYYYGETNIEFMNGKKIWLTLYRITVIAMVFAGSIVDLSVVWTFADIFMGLMAIINLIAIAKLCPIAFNALKHYSDQKNKGLDPVFTKDSIPNIEDVECW
ncbi:alanine/glycine:cation symporter family protein [Clostridium hydrogeniformans]|uniref:alanine/glycine:cation symporter family protein n=1 Tax=Clostridium hydrogeniformans TaxID=349933 RepID=UPI0004879B8E|nr:alanine/glycine:cation symporter family protein [Clostridium hydrogeniformans]